MAKNKSSSDSKDAVADAAREERRLLRDEERATKRMERAKVRLAKAEERLNRAQERFAQRQANYDAASSELLETQQLRAAGPASSKAKPDESHAEGESEVEVDSSQPSVAEVDQ